jgi:uncharacterized membrane protein
MSAVRESSETADLWTKRITRWLTRFLYGFSAHWLLMANLAIGTYVGLPLLAPVLMDTGHVRAASLIYGVFRPLCHQLPERSYFLFGERVVYSFDDLARLLGGVVPPRYIGAATLGFKVAVCERDVAIYAAMLFSGLLFVFMRNRLKPLPVKAFVLLCAPMAVDGVGQLVSLWSSTWQSRSVTGMLFGVACIWLTYPYLERGMREVRHDMGQTIKTWSK